VQHRVVSLPPAVTLFAFGLLFGSLGVLFATPLALVIFVGVKSCGCAKRSASRPSCRARHRPRAAGRATYVRMPVALPQSLHPQVAYPERRPAFSEDERQQSDHDQQADQEDDADDAAEELENGCHATSAG
jgi:hypothetical protein